MNEAFGVIVIVPSFVHCMLAWFTAAFSMVAETTLSGWFLEANGLKSLPSTCIVVVFALMGSRDGGTWMPVYLVSGIATSATGLMFPFHGFLPSHAFSILSLVLFALILLARYKFHLAGAWRWIFVSSLVLTVYLDAFVAVFQAFLKIPALHAKRAFAVFLVYSAWRLWVK